MRFVVLSSALIFGASCHRKKPGPPPPPPLEPTRVSFVAVGDIMMHGEVLRSAEQAGGFRPLWADLEADFHGTDLVFGNLETPLAPRSGKPGVPFVFNAPAALAPALKASGFHLLATANNHAYDQGAAGARETLERLESEGLVAVGSGQDRAAAESARIQEVKGLRIAFLARTGLLNQNGNAEGKGPWVARLDLDALEAAVREARRHADLVVLSLHWGIEYQHLPSPRQRAAAQRLVAAGADLIVGHHPHVLQPFEWIASGGRKGAVAFSLGNFISNQDRMYLAGKDAPEAGDSRDGGLLRACFRKDPGQPARLEEVRVDPLWTDNNWPAYVAGRESGRRIRVVDPARAPLAEAPLRLARARQVLRGL